MFELWGCNWGRFRELLVRRLLKLEPVVPANAPAFVLARGPGEETVEEGPLIGMPELSSIIITA